MAMTTPPATLTTPFVPAPTCYQPGHFSQINDLDACWTGQGQQPGAVTCQRATYGPGHHKWETWKNEWNTAGGCIPDPKQTAFTECPSGFTAAATDYRIAVRGTESVTATNTYCCPSEYDFFYEQHPNDGARIPRLIEPGKVEWDILRAEEHKLCFATSIKPLQSQTATVTLGRLKQFDQLTEKEVMALDRSGISVDEYKAKLLAAAEEVKAVWDYPNGVLVAYPQKVVQYVHQGNNKTYWGDYEYWKDLMMPAGDGTGEGKGEGWVEATSTVTYVELPLDNGAAATATSTSTSTSTSAGHKNQVQGMKLGGVLCASIMGLGVLLSF